MGKIDNTALNNAARNRKDEFYTQLTDIEKEMRHYKKYFEGKVVYCNCDDPRVSKFFEYFSENFEILKLKKLITTCYRSMNPNEFSQNDSDTSVYLEYEGDKNKNKQVDDEEIEVNNLKGDGDFRSAECIEMLKQADVVVTNPPFSLFKEFLAQLIEEKKDFIILGNMNAIAYKEVFPLIKANKIWLGPSISSGDREFGVPEHYPLEAATHRIDKHGNKFIRVKGIRWWTNIDHKKRHEMLDPKMRYNEIDYPKYDNYNAIEVGAVKNIPCDYDGYMGVPISFLDKYNPDEFELCGIMNGGEANEGIRYEHCPERKPLINGKSKFARILIRKKK